MQYVNVACENSLFENETSWLEFPRAKLQNNLEGR